MILADENIVRAIVDRLRSDGLDVTWAAELAPGAPDTDVLAHAASENRILLTDDKDFGELVVRDGLPHRGVVLLRLHGMRPDDRADLVSRLFANPPTALVDAFTVVEADGTVRTHGRSI